MNLQLRTVNYYCKVLQEQDPEKIEKSGLSGTNGQF